MKPLLLIIVALNLCNCGFKNDPQKYKDVLTLETYKVPDGLESEIIGALGPLLNVKEKEGKVRSLPGGYILVSASPNFHSGINRLMQEVAKQPPVNESNVRVSQWYVAGKESKTLKVPMPLKPIEDNLRSIFESQGYGDFHLLEQLQIVAKNGQMAEISGTYLKTKSTARIFKNQSHLVLHTKSPFDSFKSAFFIEPNQTLVLGRVGFSDKSSAKVKHIQGVLRDYFGKENSKQNIVMFYLVKTEILN